MSFSPQAQASWTTKKQEENIWEAKFSDISSKKKTTIFSREEPRISGVFDKKNNETH